MLLFAKKTHRREAWGENNFFETFFLTVELEWITFLFVCLIVLGHVDDDECDRKESCVTKIIQYSCQGEFEDRNCQLPFLLLQKCVKKTWRC